MEGRHRKGSRATGIRAPAVRPPLLMGTGGLVIATESPAACAGVPYRPLCCQSDGLLRTVNARHPDF